MMSDTIYIMNEMTRLTDENLHTFTIDPMNGVLEELALVGDEGSMNTLEHEIPFELRR